MIIKAVLDASQNDVVVDCSWVYSPETDPYAYTLTFGAGRQDATSWLIGRDLFVEGLENTSGEGDAKFYTIGSTSVLLLTAPSGSASLSFNSKEVREFVEKTLEAVPRGTEGDLVDWEKEFALLTKE